MVTNSRYTFARLALVIVLGQWILASQPARAAELTVDSLLQAIVSEPTEKQYPKVAEAITRFKHRDTEGARTLLGQAKQVDSKLPPPEILMARMYGSIGQLAGVRSELEQAVVKYPADPEAYLIFADLALQDRRVTDAEVLYLRSEPLIQSFTENLKRKRQNEIRMNIGLGAVAEAREQWDKANGYYQTWVQLDPDNVMAHQRLGRSLFKGGKAKDGYKELQAATKLDPKAMNPDIAMARLYEEAKDRANAVKFIQYAVKTNPQNIDVQLNAADWALMADQMVDAQRYADAALKVDSKSVDGQLLRGRIAWLTGDLATAESMFEQAHLLAPGNFNAANLLALVLAEQTDPAKQQRGLDLAEVNAKATTSGNRFNPEALATWGWCLYKVGRTNDAEQVLNKVLSSGQLSPDSAYYIAKLLNDRGRSADAAKLIQSALSTPYPFAQRHAAETLLAQLNVQPSTGTPDANAPDTTPDTNAPDITVPGAAAPGATAPGALPGGTGPGATAPLPGATPGVALPNVAPQDVVPGIAPDTGKK